MKVYVERSCSKCEGSGIDPTGATDNPTNPPLCAKCLGTKVEVGFIELAEVAEAVRIQLDLPQVIQVPSVESQGQAV